MYSLKLYSPKSKLTEQVAWSMNLHYFSNFEQFCVGWGISIQDKFWLYRTRYDDTQNNITDKKNFGMCSFILYVRELIAQKLLFSRKNEPLLHIVTCIDCHVWLCSICREFPWKLFAKGSVVRRSVIKELITTYIFFSKRVQRSTVKRKSSLKVIRFPEMGIRGEIKFHFSNLQPPKNILVNNQTMLLFLRWITINKQLVKDGMVQMKLYPLETTMTIFLTLKLLSKNNLKDSMINQYRVK